MFGHRRNHLRHQAVIHTRIHSLQHQYRQFRIFIGLIAFSAHVIRSAKPMDIIVSGRFRLEIFQNLGSLQLLCNRVQDNFLHFFRPLIITQTDCPFPDFLPSKFFPANLENLQHTAVFSNIRVAGIIVIFQIYRAFFKEAVNLLDRLFYQEIQQRFIVCTPNPIVSIDLSHRILRQIKEFLMGI